MKSREQSHFDAMKGDKGAALRKRAREIVEAQHADEPGGDAGARMQAENKSRNGQPPNREGGTPKTPTPPQPAEGGDALLKAMASKASASRQDAGARPAFRSTGKTHQPESGLSNPKGGKTRQASMFIGK